MTVRTKIAGILLAALVFLVLSMVLLSNMVLISRIANSEESVVMDQAKNAQDFLMGELEAMDRQMSDWAAWDDAYQFVKEKNQRFIDSGYTEPTFHNNRWDLIVFLNTKGELVFGRKVQGEKGPLVPISDEELKLSKSLQGLLGAKDLKNGIQGLVRLPECFAFISGRHILTSNYVGPSRGALIGARRLGAGELERLRRMSHLDLAILSASEENNKNQSTIWSRPQDKNIALGFVQFKDIWGQPLLVARVAVQRHIMRNFSDTMQWFLLMGFAVVLGLGLLGWLLLERLVLVRLSHMKEFLDDMNTKRDLDKRLPLDGGDELSDVAGSVNRMMDNLQEDIKLREIMEQELVRRREDLLTVLELMPIPLVIVRIPQGTVAFANRYAADYFKVPYEQVVGQIAAEFYENQEERERVLARFHADGRLQEMEIKQKDAKGGLHDALISARQITWNNEEAVLFISVDITERKRAEDERMKLDVQMRRMQSYENLGVFAGGIAHDFNNLLACQFSYLELAKEALEKQDLDRTKICLDKSLVVGKRTEALVRQLLTFSKGGAPVKRLVAVDQLLKREAEFALAGSNVKAELQVQDNLWPCAADENQISQVFDNIAINARQVMPRGGLLKIEVANVSVDEIKPMDLQPGNYVRVRMTDQGPGISKEVLSRIFDPFFTTKEQGSGLGLSIVFSVLQRHGGWVEAANASEGGACFTFYLPATPAINLDHKISDKIHKHSRLKGRVLVMDDEEHLRQALGLALESYGIQPTLTQEGNQALTVYKTAMEKGQPFDAVILDLTVPAGLGGIETMRGLLELDPKVKGIVATGYSQEAVLSNLEQYGFKAGLSKPFSLKELSRILETLLS
jgi:PAS domain S-box-containing protein